MTPGQAEAVFWLLGIPLALLLVAAGWLRWDEYRRERDEAP